MSEEIKETLYGKHNKFEIVKKTDMFGSKYWIRKDGKQHRGPFTSLSDAVEATKKEDGVKR